MSSWWPAGCRSKTRERTGQAVANLVTDGTIVPLKLEEFLPHRLEILSGLISRGLAQIYGSFGLGCCEWQLLMMLGEVVTTTATAFGTRNRIHKTRVSRAVSALLGQGLVLRVASPRDLREAPLQLSPRGEQLYSQVVPLTREYLQQLEHALTSGQRAALEQGLTRLTEQARRS
jgi:DNA-binding MarR family transcriptional regulator